MNRFNFRHEADFFLRFMPVIDTPDIEMPDIDSPFSMLIRHGRFGEWIVLSLLWPTVKPLF